MERQKYNGRKITESKEIKFEEIATRIFRGSEDIFAYPSP